MHVQVARVGIITAANTDPAYQGQYWVDMFLRYAGSPTHHQLALVSSS